MLRVYPRAILNSPVPPIIPLSITVPSTALPKMAKVLPLYGPSVNTKFSIVRMPPSFSMDGTVVSPWALPAECEVLVLNFQKEKVVNFLL